MNNLSSHCGEGDRRKHKWLDSVFVNVVLSSCLCPSLYGDFLLPSCMSRCHYNLPRSEKDFIAIVSFIHSFIHSKEERREFLLNSIPHQRKTLGIAYFHSSLRNFFPLSLLLHGKKRSCTSRFLWWRESQERSAPTFFLPFWMFFPLALFRLLPLFSPILDFFLHLLLCSLISLFPSHLTISLPSFVGLLFSSFSMLKIPLSFQRREELKRQSDFLLYLPFCCAFLHCTKHNTSSSCFNCCLQCVAMWLLFFLFPNKTWLISGGCCCWSDKRSHKSQRERWWWRRVRSDDMYWRLLQTKEKGNVF